MLEQEAGEAAINKVPRQMIREAVQSQIEKYDWDGGADVLVYVPQGVEIAKKTFNPRLGIEGGISVLGTSGIVEPMSEQALTQTIFLEMKMLRDEGHRYCYLTPGNYGNDFLRQTLGYDQELAVKCSNYIGDAIDDGVRTEDGRTVACRTYRKAGQDRCRCTEYSFQTGGCKNGSACRPCGNGRGRPGDSLCSDEVFYDEGSIGYSGRKRTFGRDDADRDGEDRVSFGEACRREDEGRGADVFG